MAENCVYVEWGDIQGDPADQLDLPGSYTVTLTFSGAPSDSTSYYGGAGANANAAGTTTDSFAENNYEIAVPGTIVAVSFNSRSAGTLGSTENVVTAIRHNDATNIASTSEARFDVASESWLVTGLDVAVAVGDRIALLVTAPAWATNPTSVALTAVVHIKPTT